MPRFKVTEWLKMTSDQRGKFSHIILHGNNPIFPDIILEMHGREKALWPEALEKIEIRDARSLLMEWSSGSLMGTRLLKVTIPGKLKNPEYLIKVVNAPNDEDQIVINSEEYWPTLNLEKTKAAVIECKELTTAKERAKFIEVRAKDKAIKMTDDQIKELAQRLPTSLDVEVNLSTLKLYLSGQDLQDRDIVALLGEPERFSDLNRLLITGNQLAIQKEILKAEPIVFLSTAIKVLHKLYIFLTSPKEIEDQVLSELKIGNWALKDWKRARLFYDAKLIREINAELVAVYQECRRGKSYLWQEITREILIPLQTKKV